ncbi:MAG TPA: IS607 family transposase [Acidimicrobiales bacterium]|nr:IS607 family transposase [Acidimicrobiales bacterium]
MKLSEWARANGVSRQSATRWFHGGVLPVPARQLATGTILASRPAPPRWVWRSAAVSSGDQRGDLDRQIARLTAVVTGRGLAPTRVVAEVGSRLNAQGRRLMVVEEAEVADDLVRDIVEVLTSLCVRLYGRRSARRRAEAALVATQSPAAA